MRKFLSIIEKFITFLILAVLVIVGGHYYLTGEAESSKINHPQTEPARLVYVIDGDTLIVTLNGVEEKVRLLGIDAPESVHRDSSRNTEEGIQASNFAKFLLEDVTEVYLEKDITDRDRYGRLLRYVWISKDYDHPDKSFLNGILVKNGYAKVQDFPPDTGKSEYLHAQEP